MDSYSAPTTEVTVARFMPYLSEVRKRLLFVLSVFFIAGIIGFIYYQPIIVFIIGLYELDGINLTFTSPFEFVTLAVKTGMMVGSLIALPFLVHQTMSFLQPALSPKEFKRILSYLPVSAMLFIFGFGFGAWIMKFIVSVYAKQTSQLQIGNLWDINVFLGQLFFTALFLGIVFQFPIIMSLLFHFKVVKYSTIASQRLIAYAIILIVTVLLPPTDVTSLLMMFFPLAIIFEITLLLNRKHKFRV